MAPANFFIFIANQVLSKLFPKCLSGVIYDLATQDADAF